MNDISKIIDRCLEVDGLHARLLSTFSLIENTGACRIHRFERFGFHTEEVLRHAFEEARHAYLFKKLSNAVCQRAGLLEEAIPFAARHSRNFIRKLDIGVTRALKEEGYGIRDGLFYLEYLIVTLLVENRALAIYQLYNRALQKAAKSFSISSVIKEEKGHLDYLKAEATKMLGSEGHALMGRLKKCEAYIFGEWLEEMDSVLTGSTTDAYPVQM